MSDQPRPLGVNCAQATESFSATLSALNCPTRHSNVVPVETLAGERVATLCPDCDQQLPAEWRTPAERAKAMERDHNETHHGHPAVLLLACRLCGEEARSA